MGEIETKSRRKAISPLHTEYRRFGDKIKKNTPGQGLFGLIIFAVTRHAIFGVKAEEVKINTSPHGEHVGSVQPQ